MDALLDGRVHDAGRIGLAQRVVTWGGITITKIMFPSGTSIDLDTYVPFGMQSRVHGGQFLYDIEKGILLHIIKLDALHMFTVRDKKAMNMLANMVSKLRLATGKTSGGECPTLRDRFSIISTDMDTEDRTP